MGENFLVSQQIGVDIGGEITKVFTKFDSKKIKLRRAFSFEELPQRQGTDGTKIEEASEEDSYGDE